MAQLFSSSSSWIKPVASAQARRSCSPISRLRGSWRLGVGSGERGDGLLADDGVAVAGHATVAIAASTPLLTCTEAAHVVWSRLGVERKFETLRSGPPAARDESDNHQ